MRLLSIAAILALVSTPALASDVAVIVRFHGNADASIFARHGGQAGIDLGDGQAHAGRVPAGRLRALRAEAGVASVSEDAIATTCAKPGGGGTTPPPQQTTPWGITKIGAPSLWGTERGAGVNVAVLDTGIFASHPDLTGRVVTGASFVDYNTSSSDDHGHGTHVAGTIGATDNTIGVVGVAPSATLIPVKVLDRNGSGNYSWIVAGINWAVANGAKVINMSLGGSVSDPSLETAVTNANTSGVFVAAAAGNGGRRGAANYPAAYASAVAVAATDSFDVIASFSTQGNYVDLAAPGVSVNSTTFDGKYASNSGTSMATPHVAGAAALLMGLNKNNAAARAALESTALDLGTQGHDKAYGWGRINVAAAAAN